MITFATESPPSEREKINSLFTKLNFMQKSLLTTLLLSGALAVSAAVPEAGNVGTAPAASVLAAPGAAKAAPLASKSKTINDNHVRVKQFNRANVRTLAAPVMSKSIKPMVKAHRAPQAGENGVILFESFENPTEDFTWLPDGWTQVSYATEDLGDQCHWGVDQGGMFLPSPTDGDWMASVFFSYDNPEAEQDEWLISPEVALPVGNYDLSFDIYASPFFFFNIDADHFDWDAFDFIEREVVYTVEVLVSADGGEYEKIYDFAQDFTDLTVDELLEIDGFVHRTVSLAEYGGKDIKVAFRLVGHDCNSEFIDSVMIALPELSLDIAPDYSIQYYGLSSDPVFSALTVGVGLMPVYAPFEFYNYSYNEGATYTWHFCDPTTYEWTTTDGEEVLELTYAPDYSSDFSKSNNLVYTPYLSATAEGYCDTEISLPNLPYIQAGGIPSWPAGDETLFFGAVPFNVVDTKVGGYSVVYDKVGDAEVPIFGHNPSTTQWWTEYTLGEDAGEDDSVEVVAILNYIYTVPGAKMVFDKAWLHAFGTFEDDVEFTCGIYQLSPEGEPAADPMVAATIKGGDVEKSPQGGYNLVSLVFDFGEPVVLDGDEGCYIVKISGFNSDKVEFFEPFQQWRPGELALGWIEKTITWDGTTGTSYSPIAYHENSYGDMYCAFEINLGAWYPWLDAEEQTVELGEGCEGSIKLATYYDGADLTITASDWIEASASGRYDECVVSVVATSAEAAREGFVTVSAPGVEAKTFKVKQDVTGISSVAAEGRQVKAVFTPAGVQADMSVPGIYVVTYTDGTVEKKIVK